MVIKNKVKKELKSYISNLLINKYKVKSKKIVSEVIGYVSEYEYSDIEFNSDIRDILNSKLDWWLLREYVKRVRLVDRVEFNKYK